MPKLNTSPNTGVIFSYSVLLFYGFAVIIFISMGQSINQPLAFETFTVLFSYFIILYLVVLYGETGHRITSVFGIEEVWLKRILVVSVIISILFLFIGQIDVLDITIGTSVNDEIQISGFIRAPIYEEILFRGLLFYELEEHYGPRTANLVQAITFGLWHLPVIFLTNNMISIFITIISTFALGLTLGLIRIQNRTNWMFYCIFIHWFAVIINSISGFIVI